MTVTIGVLGTGIMGFPMARNLARAGMTVAAWNRTRSKAEPLAADGVRVADTPAEAAAGADLVLTMLLDGDVVAATMTGPDGALAAMRPDAVWLQTSTVGSAAADRLGELARDRGVGYLDCPVLGTKVPAEEGKLVVLASGDERLRAAAQPVFDAIGSRTMWLGDAGAGSRLKLVVNSWVLAVVGAVAEAVALSGAFGLDPQAFLDALEGTALDLPYAHLKGGMMMRDEFPTSFPVNGARKDARLIGEAMTATGLSPRVVSAVREMLDVAADRGHGGDDMAAAVHGVRS